MEIMELVNWAKDNGKTVLDVVAYSVMIASAIVKLTPTLRDDNFLKPVVKFLGKYIAWDKYGPKGIELEESSK